MLPTAQLNAAYEAYRVPNDIRRSLRFIICGNLFGCLWGIICGSGTNTMIDLANDLGAGDLVFGILNAIPQIAVVLQIPFAMIVNYTHKRKKYLLTYGLFSRFIWLIIGLIPILIPMEAGALRMWAVLFLLGISQLIGSFINVCWFPWLGDLTPVEIRGTWISTRDSINSIVSIVGGLVIAGLLETLTGYAKYLILFGIGSIFGMIDMICFGFCKEVYASPSTKPSLKAMGKDIFTNRKFFMFMIFWTVWCFTANFSGAYLNRYMINEMDNTYMQITICTAILPSLIAAACVRRWSRVINEYGIKNGLWLTSVLASLTPLFFLFATKGSFASPLLHNCIGAALWCGTNLVATQVQLSYSTDENRAGSIAVFSAVTAIVGTFLGIMAGGWMLEALQDVAFPAGFDRYKLVILLSVVLRFAAVLIFVPLVQNDKEYTLRETLVQMKEHWHGFTKTIRFIKH